MINFGTVKPGQTIYVPFDSFASATGASITLTGLAVTDIEIYKDGSTTQRASDNGYTLLDTDGIDFDGITGIHGFSIDLADNSTAGFYSAGSRYFVVVSSVTVDSQTVTFLAARFVIGYPGAILDTTIATLATQTSFTLTAGPAEDDALNGCWLVAHDVASAVQQAVGIVLDYTGSTKTVTLAAAPTFTMSTTDNISVMGPMPMQPTVIGRTLDVSTGGEAGLDWANIGSPTTSQTLSGTTVGTATALGAGAITAAVIATDAIDADAIAANAIDAAAIADGAIDAATFAAGAITAAVIATDAIDADALATNAVTEIQAGLATQTSVDDLPTNAELATALGTADDAVLAAIATVQADTDNIQTRLPAALVGGKMDSDATSISGDSVAADNAESFFDGTGYAGTNNVIPSVTTVTGNVNGTIGGMAAGSITAASIATGAIDADALAADAATEIATAVLAGTIAELGVAAPAATPTLAQAVMLPYMALRDKRTVTSTKDTIFNDAGTAIAHADLTDDGTTFTASELASGA